MTIILVNASGHLPYRPEVVEHMDSTARRKRSYEGLQWTVLCGVTVMIQTLRSRVDELFSCGRDPVIDWTRRGGPRPGAECLLNARAMLILDGLSYKTEHSRKDLAVVRRNEYLES